MAKLQSVIGKVQKSIADSVRDNTYIQLETETILKNQLFELIGIHRIDKNELIKIYYDEISGMDLFGSDVFLAKGYEILNPDNPKEVLFSHKRLL